MRLVAGVADHASGMLYAYDLGDVRGLGRILLVTAHAKRGHIRQLRLERRRVFRMPGQGTVASLTADADVFAGRERFGFVIMAQSALGFAGKSEGLLAVDLEC